MIFDLFRRNRTGSVEESSTAARPTRRSSGLAEFNKIIAGRESLAILDLGPTSPQNIRLITEMGHRSYSEDVLLSSFDPQYTVTDDKGRKTIAVERFLHENLKYGVQQFDAVICWDVPDYLPEDLVRPLVDKLADALKPGGVLLAFFHTKDAGPDAPFFRYHIAGTDTLELQRGPQFQLQRVFNNRHIENLFKQFSSLKFFLARDNVREVLVIR